MTQLSRFILFKGLMILVLGMSSFSVAQTEHYEFALTDSAGRAVSQNDWSDRYLLVIFGYTHCPDICPLTLLHMSNALDNLGDLAKRVKPVFVSIDPQRDTRERVAGYVAHFHPDFAGLTGTPEQLAQVAKRFRVVYGYKQEGRPVDPVVDGEYEVYHSAHIYLLSPERELVDVFGYNMDGAVLAEKLKALVK